jgi:MFS family permease
MNGLVRDLVPAPGPARLLGVMTVVHVAGLGLFLTSSVVYLNRVVGMAPHTIGLVLSAAGGLGFLSAVPAGRLVDRFSPRGTVAVVYALLGLLLLGYAYSRSVALVVVLTCGITVLETANSPMRAALVYALFGKGNGAHVRAQMRSIANAGFGLGAVLAGAVLALGSATAFRVAFTAAAAAYLGCAALVLRLPDTRPEAAAATAVQALRNVRFIAVTLVSGALEINIPLLTVGIPAWLVTHTDVSPSLVAVLMLINTGLVVLLQVRAARGADTAIGAGNLQRRAGFVIAAACGVYAVSDYTTGALSVAVIVLGTVVLTWGELLQAAGSYGLAYELPPPGRQGEYQGVFSLARGFQQFVGPVLVVATAVAYGLAGWLVLAAFFVLAGLLCPPLVRAAAAHSGREPAEPAPATTT